ncbi:hypothetical protein B0H12DRAFT_54471 [Mycena haematopus]|nr:hypothetical protein B0H12DRAFT_54471 [Mycena haematopus]
MPFRRPVKTTFLWTAYKYTWIRQSARYHVITGPPWIILLKPTLRTTEKAVLFLHLLSAVSCPVPFTRLVNERSNGSGMVCIAVQISRSSLACPVRPTIRLPLSPRHRPNTLASRETGRFHQIQAFDASYSKPHDVLASSENLTNLPCAPTRNTFLKIASDGQDTAKPKY